ncbi:MULTISPECIES: DUF6268 family outer membrane beta-barrel protein [Nonlabens]|uniref:DUF6268 domain-containing protein n=2 Tax=Nonlabens ulvanivorans TaxID=906888 RepID=A0A081D9Y0_NONUL|nr:DUF6268 family outer membrane beta-barrel protein [Nonlabens ulvanivorans]WOI24187.1 DUF6268 family outer membrane beta-barrel protein [Nonlabens ulvanivorans]GAK75726.1 hypothetical protein JCM19296_1318 [Nonlabens ulvanivorans]GAL75450.1 hypothetical protein JCM19275_1901 [Nonlabens ulvanivorans]
MKNQLTIIIALLGLSIATAQNYLDIARINISNTTLEDLEQTHETNITNVNLEFLLPTPINDKTILITGLTAENSSLVLSNGLSRENLIMTRINLGAKVYHSKKWTGTYLLLPKIASNLNEVASQDFQIGAIALLEYRHKNRFRTKYGLYSSSEEFGTIITPLLGVYYRTPNNKFYIDAAFPIRMEANYNVTKKFSLGADLRTSVKSYNLGLTDRYVQEESIRGGLYASYSLMDDKLILRAKAGLDTTDYGLYNSGDRIGAQILTIQVNGDDRARLNNEFDSSVYFGFDAIYRLNL